MLDYRIVNMFCFKATKPSIRMTQPELPVCRPFEPQDTNHCSDGPWSSKILRCFTKWTKPWKKTTRSNQLTTAGYQVDYKYSYILIILVGGWPTPLKNMKVNGKDYPIYCGKIQNVWNHQPNIIHKPLNDHWISPKKIDSHPEVDRIWICLKILYNVPPQL